MKVMKTLFVGCILLVGSVSQAQAAPFAPRSQPLPNSIFTTFATTPCPNGPGTFSASLQGYFSVAASLPLTRAAATTITGSCTYSVQRATKSGTKSVPAGASCTRENITMAISVGNLGKRVTKSIGPRSTIPNSDRRCVYDLSSEMVGTGSTVLGPLR